jgi:hypothetical protein
MYVCMYTYTHTHTHTHTHTYIYIYTYIHTYTYITYTYTLTLIYIYIYNDVQVLTRRDPTNTGKAKAARGPRFKLSKFLASEETLCSMHKWLGDLGSSMRRSLSLYLQASYGSSVRPHTAVLKAPYSSILRPYTAVACWATSAPPSGGLTLRPHTAVA